MILDLHSPFSVCPPPSTLKLDSGDVAAVLQHAVDFVFLTLSPSLPPSVMQYQITL